MTAEGGVDPTGGEVCLPDHRVCVSFPTGAIDKSDVIRIEPTSDVPPAALSEGYAISFTRNQTVTFTKPAKVSFSLDIVRTDGLPNESVLRIYSKQGDEWLPLDNTFVDRVRNVVTGETTHFSPFVVLRSDRLPDGGLPIELDGGEKDSGIIYPPYDGSFPMDAGRPDAGRPDAGRPDSGTPDAGQPDAGRPDSGTPDAGQPDAGQPDAGQPDAGQPDAGQPDAGQPDAGQPDAGQPDAGQPDAGQPDAGQPDAGDGG